MQLAVIILFYVLILLVGLQASRHGGSKDWEGLMLAGRGLPIWFGALTMTATWVGGGYINGTAEAIYDPAQGIVWTIAPWGYALSMTLGGLFFARRMRERNYTTLLDPFEQQYGATTAAWLFIPAVVGEVFWSAAILVALGTTFGTVLGYNVVTSIWVSALVAISYTVVGGLWSVAYTDVVQLACMLVGLGIAVPYALAHVGGPQVVLEQAAAQMPRFPTDSAIWLWIDMALLLCLGGIPWQVYFQRVLAAKDAPTAMRLSFLASFGCLLMAIPAVILGAVGIAADWSTTSAQAAPEPALVLPSVLAHLTPTVVATLGIGAVAAAVMSSVDSSILSASSMFVWNVYRPQFRPHADSRELRTALRATVVVVGLAATCVAVLVQSVYALWYLCADLVYVILFPQLVMVLYFPRANRTAALAGAAVALLLRLGGGEPMLGLPAWIPYPLATPDGGTHFPFRTFSMLCGLLTIGLLSIYTGKSSSSETSA